VKMRMEACGTFSKSERETRAQVLLFPLHTPATPLSARLCHTYMFSKLFDFETKRVFPCEQAGFQLGCSRPVNAPLLIGSEQS